MLIDDALALIKDNKITVLSGLYCVREVTFETESGITTRIMESTRLLSQHLIDLFTLIADNTSLIKLDLTKNLVDINPHDIKSLLERQEILRSFRNAFQKNQTLKTLNLSKNYLTDELAYNLAKILKVNKTLKTLILRNMNPIYFSFFGNHISSSKMCEAFSSSNLEVLDVSKNRFKDEGVRQIISAFAGHHSLRELHINGNGISKAFLKEMPELIATIPMLKTIELGKKVKRRWNKKIRDDIQKSTNNNLEFFEACNFLLMHWWRESRSPHSESPLSLLPSVVITCILRHLSDLYRKTTSDKVLHDRTRLFAKEQDKTLYKNLFPKDIIKKPIIKDIASLKEGKTSIVCNYAITANGQLLFGKKFDGPGGSHIDLANGKRVRCAGEVKFKNGKLIEYDNASGHYLPGPKQTKKEMAFALQAIEKKRIKFVEKEWIQNKKQEDGGEWVPVGNRK